MLMGEEGAQPEYEMFGHDGSLPSQSCKEDTVSVALQITGLWLNLHFLLCSWTFKSDLQAGEEELLLVAVEQVHIPASGSLMLDLQRKCQHVSLTEIKV